jgi:sugar O-acyltransferase (sialic acid O-acetyltransferase NeuD family)
MKGVVAVLGAGGHGKVVIATLQAAGWQVAAVYDDAEDRWGASVLGVPLQGPLDAAAASKVEGVVVAVGDNRARKSLAERFDLPWIAVVHPAAVVHPSVELGAGTVVFAGAAIQPDTWIGRHTIVNTGASVDHDCRLGDFVHVAPGARLGGGVAVGEGALIGIGSCVVPGVTIGPWATVGAGAAVVRDVAAGATVVGVPARLLPLG